VLSPQNKIWSCVVCNIKSHANFIIEIQVRGSHSRQSTGTMRPLCTKVEPESLGQHNA
jgi:hypothetical protein